MANPNYVFTYTLARGLRDLGATDAVVTPGSRNTPLALAFAETDGIASWIHHDERSAAFFALGLAKTTGRPVILVCTSGTAAAEYLPALTEARHARVPLIALTADRPPELRQVAAPQSINQIGIYGPAVKWSHEAGTPTTDYPPGPYAARLAGAAWTRSLDSPAGPVHLNCPFREPLAPIDLPQIDNLAAVAPVHQGSLIPGPAALQAVAEQLSGRRVLLVAGEMPAEAIEPVAALSAALDAPLFADPLSGLRAGHHDKSRVITTGDTLARAGLLDGRLAPEVVVRFGAPATSKALAQRLSGNPPVTQVVVDDAEWRQPTTGAATMVRGTSAATASALVPLVSPGGPDWMQAWREADNKVQHLWSEIAFPSEPAVIQTIAAHLPSGSRLWVASSMPIRDLDSFCGPTERPIRIVANRGANGIDGFVSSVLGSAAAGPAPTFGVSGDLSLLHDLTALAGGVRLGLDATIVVINNDGGGIFHFLPQADHPEFFESHLVTPHGLDFGPLVEGFGAVYQLVEEHSGLVEALTTPPSGIRVVEVRTDRRHNADLHEAWWRKAAETLSV